MFWSDKCDKSFEYSKDLLLNNQLLEKYDPKRQIIVCTDGSPYEVGAILAQVVNGIEKPGLFASSTLSVAEQKYSQLHRKVLAIKFVIFSIKITKVTYI